MATEKEAWKISRLIIRVQLARYFHVNPLEFEGVPERKLMEILAVVEAMADVESGDGENAGK